MNYADHSLYVGIMEYPHKSLYNSNIPIRHISIIKR